MTEYGGNAPHLYISTACQHGLCSTGMPGEGSRCRDTCKFCGTGCLHECHVGGVPDDTTLRERIANAVAAMPGEVFPDDRTYYWAVADTVLKALREIPAGC